ncbi:hypothetical protein ACROYT_G020996 [Oculina patagonica]
MCNISSSLLYPYKYCLRYPVLLSSESCASAVESEAVFRLSKCGKDQDFLCSYCNSDNIPRMNQLQSLLHDSLIATGHVQHCAIIRRKDTSLRASTVGFSPSLDNIHALVHSFTNSSQARREGLKFQDTVYECVRADRFSVYAKHENNGIILVRTATLLLVATYTPEMSPSICVEAVEKLADYFREKGK